MLEGAVAEAEAKGDEPTLADALLPTSRAYMRTRRSRASIAAADRALAIAERLDLEPIVAEAMLNKASALNQLGRRREAIALHESAWRCGGAPASRLRDPRAQQPGGAIADDDPLRAGSIVFETLGVAREVGDRSMFNWLTAMLRILVRAEARGWDEQIAECSETLETATVRSDRSPAGFRSVSSRRAARGSTRSRR